MPENQYKILYRRSGDRAYASHRHIWPCDILKCLRARADEMNEAAIEAASRARHENCVPRLDIYQ